MPSTKEERRAFEIANLEEQVKTLQFQVRDAEWVIANHPGEIEELRARIKALEVEDGRIR